MYCVLQHIPLMLAPNLYSSNFLAGKDGQKWLLYRQIPHFFFVLFFSMCASLKLNDSSIHTH